MLKVCREKCIPHEYGESELNKGESVCVDRCVLKYMETNLKIGQYAQSVRLDAKDLNFHEYLKSKYTEKKKE
ncbi:hypothetical protein PACTADRAFT_52176 [Pachysolen tannophilus NRRL Y-2460]|nr:hypothetical protein PACTADRAFT_52176 [Pachysolen tannophilus NRRL Y-2460]